MDAQGSSPSRSDPRQMGREDDPARELQKINILLPKVGGNLQLSFEFHHFYYIFGSQLKIPKQFLSFSRFPKGILNPHPCNFTWIFLC